MITDGISRVQARLLRYLITRVDLTPDNKSLSCGGVNQLETKGEHIMAHDLATINGKSAFFGTQAAWHKLGQVVEGAKVWAEAMDLAQLNWTVSKHQLLSPLDNRIVPAWGIFKDDNGQMLGAVGDQYTPIQNKFAFEYVDSILNADEGAHYVSAGALGKGERIWCLAQVNGQTDITGTGDVHNWYLLFCTSHDGSLSATCKLTSVRVVCNNTLTSALRLNGEFTRVKHTKEAASRLDAARKVMSNAHQSIKEVEEKLRELSKRIVTKDSFKNVMVRLFGDYEAKADKGASVARIENKITEVAQLYESNDRNMFPEIKGTGYNLLNAVTEWTDHKAGVRRTEDRQGMSETQIRAENSLFGTGAALKESALEVILEATANAQRKSEVIYTRAPAPIIPAAITSSGSSMLDNIIDNMG